mmetsp:Transcript_37533/g.57502  ORF Transcript_37533/g.57502 Transcript_37533/m.57502 type:complete len:372 (+) Transcript_37533:1404-2519(+)
MEPAEHLSEAMGLRHQLLSEALVVAVLVGILSVDILDLVEGALAVDLAEFVLDFDIGLALEEGLVVDFLLEVLHVEHQELLRFLHLQEVLDISQQVDRKADQFVVDPRPVGEQRVEVQHNELQCVDFQFFNLMQVSELEDLQAVADGEITADSVDHNHGEGRVALRPSQHEVEVQLLHDLDDGLVLIADGCFLHVQDLVEGLEGNASSVRPLLTLRHLRLVVLADEQLPHGVDSPQVSLGGVQLNEGLRLAVDLSSDSLVLKMFRLDGRQLRLELEAEDALEAVHEENSVGRRVDLGLELLEVEVRRRFAEDGEEPSGRSVGHINILGGAHEDRIRRLRVDLGESLSVRGVHVLGHLDPLRGLHLMVGFLV